MTQKFWEPLDIYGHMIVSNLNRAKFLKHIQFELIYLNES